jgi:hypothetical protein
MASFFKKIVIIFVILSVLSTNFILFSTIKKADAFVGWFGIQTVSIPSILEHIWEVIQKLRDTIVKRLMDMITADVIDSINNGGSPQFVQDWKGYLRKAGDVALDTFNTYLQTSGFNLCAPFAPQLQIQLINTYKYYNLRYSQMPVMCSFDNFKRNLENTKGIIERGDWVSYDAAFSPDVNPYWLSLTMEDEYVRKMTEEQDSKQNEAQSSSGFLGQKTCTEYSDNMSPDEAKSYCEQSVNLDQCNDDTKLDECKNGQIKTCLSQLQCTKSETQTPGDVVAKAITGSTGIEKDPAWLSNVQSVISAIINVAINKIFQKGLSNLVGGDQNGEGYSYDGDMGAICNSSKMDLLDAQTTYKNIPVHISKYISPILNSDVSLINSKSCASSTASSTISISITDENGIVSTTTIGELNDYLVELKNDATNAVASSTSGNQEIKTILDAIDSGGCTQDLVSNINAAMQNYQKFISDYQQIFADMQTRNATKKPGPLEIELNNIKKALENFNCLATPVSRRKSFVVFA